jgi:curli production assembly/transport component CsgF
MPRRHQLRVLAFCLVSLVGCAAFAGSASATQLVYQPTNPNFGGNPLNGSYLLTTAQAQGFGAKAAQNSPDLSGLTNALSNLGTGTGTSTAVPTIVIEPVPTSP